MTNEKPLSIYAAMDLALTQAAIANQQGEVPIGCVILDKNGTPIAQCHNRNRQCHDPTAHCEMLAIQHACRTRQSRYLYQCSMFVTLAPCPMCFTAICFARLQRLYFGAYDTRHPERANAYLSYPNNRLEIYGGIEERRCQTMLDMFFAQKR
ncbi:MAG: nucleoside deaminase [Alphaproteobacteria bacterium GM7ARS4]|nr:nucleoside deaminase [Alphaproteobacteria bacterium GM7ARS4]